jgi:cytoskeletal protein CcmA (bactofilin family)
VKEKARSGALNGFLDRGARMEGTLTFEDTFRIDGEFKGLVVSEHELVVGDAAVIEGEIRVGRLAVSGTIRGVIRATERVEVHAGARLYAELHTPALVVEDGAILQGPVEAGPLPARPETPPVVQAVKP